MIWQKIYSPKRLLSLVTIFFFFHTSISALKAEQIIYSYNNFGGIGLLDMRTARFSPDGTVAVGFHHNGDVTRYFSSWQATPWLETTLSYSNDRSNNLGVDRSLDVKMRLLTEGDYRPQVAIGIQDALGTGHFGAEYIVASKRYYDFDFTMGFAWGYLGSRGGLGNIFRIFGDSFEQRSITTSNGGIRTGSFFSGHDMSFFAGAEYHPNIKGLSFKVEYSGVDTTKIAEFSHLKRNSAFNLGMNYKATPWADVAIGFDRGNSLSLRLILKQNLHKLKFKKWFRGPKAVTIKERQKFDIAEDISSQETNEKVNPEQSTYDKMIKSNLSPIAISLNGKNVHVRKETGPFFNEVKNIGRTARILTNEMPDEVEEFVIISEKNGTDISKVSILRQDIEKTKNFQSSPEEIRANSKISIPSSDSFKGEEIYQSKSGIRFNGGFKPELRTHFGGNEDGRFRADLYAKLYGSIQFSKHLKLTAELKQYILGDIDKIPLDTRPEIQKVRSDIARYAKDGRTALERVQMNYTTQIDKNIYVRITGGILESMYGGFGAEFLYRPYNKNYAFSFDMNWVKQRDFDQLFSFRKYDVFTGHATFYHESIDYDITSKLSVGRYLAGDYGATFDVSRRFNNGIRIGFWATVTDMTSEKFGGGSFDKGIYLTMPLEILWYRPSQEKMRFNFRSLGKNGGQRLDRNYDLYDMVSSGRKNRILRDWNEILN